METASAHIAKVKGSFPLQWGHRFTSVETPHYSGGDLASGSFNGATDLHRWKLPGGRYKNPPMAGLQWGHRFTSVETPTYPPWSHPKQPASMGPPIYIGGNRKRNRVRKRCEQGFNGATDLHRWKRPAPTSPRSRAPSRFNGATDLHRWKLPTIVVEI